MKPSELLSLFKRVSNDYPSSITAQAARLSLATKRNQTIPALFQTMRTNEADIENIAVSAEKAHAASDNKKAPIHLNRDILRLVLASEEEKIRWMSRLRTEQLVEIIELRHKFPNEKEYEAYVNERYFRE